LALSLFLLLIHERPGAIFVYPVVRSRERPKFSAITGNIKTVKYDPTSQS